MTDTIGIGTGLIILITIWIVAFIVAVISLRTEKIIGIIAIATALLITVIIFIIPVEKVNSEQFEEKVMYI